jgi:hypothetical protein
MLFNDRPKVFLLSLKGAGVAISRSEMIGVDRALDTSGLFGSGDAGGVAPWGWLLWLSHRGWLLTTKKYSTRRCAEVKLFNVPSTETFRRSFDGVDALALFPILLFDCWLDACFTDFVGTLGDGVLKAPRTSEGPSCSEIASTTMFN